MFTLIPCHRLMMSSYGTQTVTLICVMCCSCSNCCDRNL